MKTQQIKKLEKRDAILARLRMTAPKETAELTRTMAKIDNLPESDD